jgi:predicted metal-dependent phosphoesterase TrpH
MSRQRLAHPPGLDLHVHSTHSDGSLAPAELVRAAAQAGLAGLAITDHDCASACAPAAAEASRLGLELIPGIELAARWKERPLDLLGYFFHQDHPRIAEHARNMRDLRRRRLDAMISRLQARGLAIQPEPILRAHPRAMLGRRHLARWLVASGQVPSLRLAFQRWLGDHAPCAAPLPRLELDQAIELIRTAGGCAALAHPGPGWKYTDLALLRELGVDAIELIPPSRQHHRASHLAQWADSLGFIPIAGSDFHDPDAGRRLGSARTSPESLERLRAAALARRAA